MTILETKEILITRLGWRDDKTVKDIILSAANTTSDSTRYYQSEHSAVTLQNIRDCQPIPNISNQEFNEYLENLVDQCASQVLGDVFEKDYVNDNLLKLYPTAFDNCLSLRMVIMVAELIMTSTRINSIKRLGDEFVAKLNYDIYREAPNKFAIRGTNYRHTMGISMRYGVELRTAQTRFGTQKNRLKTITRGQAI